MCDGRALGVCLIDYRIPRDPSPVGERPSGPPKGLQLGRVAFGAVPRMDWRHHPSHPQAFGRRRASPTPAAGFSLSSLPRTGPARRQRLPALSTRRGRLLLTVPSQAATVATLCRGPGRPGGRPVEPFARSAPGPVVGAEVILDYGTSNSARAFTLATQLQRTRGAIVPWASHPKTSTQEGSPSRYTRHGLHFLLHPPGLPPIFRDAAGPGKGVGRDAGKYPLVHRSIGFFPLTGASHRPPVHPATEPYCRF